MTKLKLCNFKYRLMHVKLSDLYHNYICIVLYTPAKTSFACNLSVENKTL